MQLEPVDLLGNLSAWSMQRGKDWDKYLGLLSDAYESATILCDRSRLLTFMTLLHSCRGERLVREQPMPLLEVVPFNEYSRNRYYQPW